MADPFLTDGTSLTWRGSGETLRIQPWGADSVRVRAVLGGPLRDSDWALLEPEAAAEGRCAVVIDGDLSSAYSLGSTMSTKYAIENLVPKLEAALK